MKNKILYLLLLLPAFSFAQPAGKNITGVWKGEFYVDSTKQTYPFELVISGEKGKYTGYSRIAFEENGIKQVVFRDHKISITDNSIVIEDKSQLSKASSIRQPEEVKKVMRLELRVMDTVMQLNGTWSTNKTRRYLAATGTANMQRKVDFKSTEIFKKLDTLALTERLSFNKPVIIEPEPLPEKIINRQILNGIAKIEIPARNIKLPGKINKPNPSIRPKELPVAIIEKPIPKKTVEPAPVITKPATAAIKPVAAAKQPVIAKVENQQPVAKPVIVKEIKPDAIAVVPEKKKTIPVIQGNAAIDVNKRSISGTQSFYYNSDSLQLTLYDNGEIDGDTVSVLLDGKLIIAKQGLNTKPNVHTIYFDKNTADSMMLVMYAENLGSIPPNTGLLVIREGRSVYEVRFSADLKTNAAVILRRRKEE